MKELLTNEKLKGLFKSNFELARHAIRLAKYYVKSGRELNLEDLLDEVRRHPREDYFTQLQEMETHEEESEEVEGV